MAKTTKTAEAPRASDIAQLTEAVQDLSIEVRQLGAVLNDVRRDLVEDLNHQVQQLSIVLDEIRQDIVHAVRNGKFNGCAAEEQWQVVTSPIAATPHPNEPTKESISTPAKVNASQRLRDGQGCLFE